MQDRFSLSEFEASRSIATYLSVYIYSLFCAVTILPCSGGLCTLIKSPLLSRLHTSRASFHVNLLEDTK